MLLDFLREVDEKQTHQNARRVLSQYRKLKRMAGVDTQSLTASYSPVGRVTGGQHSDHVFRTAELRREAQKELKWINEALRIVEDNYREILERRYCSFREEADISIYMDLVISESTYYKYLRKAEVQFAEGYKNGELLVFKD